MPNRLCGEYGYKTKAGTPCRFILAPDEQVCKHHSADKTKQKQFIAKAHLCKAENTVPKITTNDFQTINDCLNVRAQCVDALVNQKRLDLKRVDMILKACTGASQDHATKAAEEQNKLLLALEGHGAGIAMLQRLKDAPVRVLPGRRKVLDLDVKAVVQEEEDKEAS